MNDCNHSVTSITADKTGRYCKQCGRILAYWGRGVPK